MLGQESSKRPRWFSVRAMLAAAAVATIAGSAEAVPLYWQPTTADSWNTPANWSDAAAGGGANQVPTINDTATFNITPNNTTAAAVTLDAAQSAGGIVVATTGGATITAGTSGPFSLTLGSSGISLTAATSLTIGSSTSAQNVPVILGADQTWATNSSATNGALIIKVLGSISAGNTGTTTLTLAGTTGSSSLNIISGAISDGGTGSDRTLNIAMSPLSSTGNGNRWTLSGNNTYTGTTTINNGALTIGNVNALGATSAGTTVAAGAGLFFRASVGTIAAEPLTLAGNGANVGSSGSLRNVNGTNVWTGTISANTTITGGTVIGCDAGLLQFNLSAVITTTGTNALGFTGGGAFDVHSAINGPAALTKSGAGTLTLSFDDKTYTGSTTVSAGTLQLNAALTATSAVTVASAATLRGSGGSIASTATTTVNGTISGGTAAATTGTFATGPLSLTNTGTFALDFNSTTQASDLINVTGNLTLDSGNATTLEVADLGSTVLPAGTTIPFIDYSGTWNGGLFTLAGTGVLTDNGTVFQVGVNQFQVDYNYGGPNGAVALVSVPEPTAGAALLTVAFGLLASRRRRTSRPNRM